MNIDAIKNRLNIESTVTNKNSNNTTSFGDYLKAAVDSVNEAQVKADEETMKVISGESEDLHQALIAAEEARLQMELVVQVRNKLVESYQEIARMQI